MVHQMARDATEESVFRLLSDLGENPDDIARSLREKNVHGMTYAPDMCPISMYLRRHVPGARVCVSIRTANLVIPTEPGHGDFPNPGTLWRHVDARVPIQVSKFIRKFDDENYPELMIK